MPAMPGTPWRRRKASRSPSLRQFGGAGPARGRPRPGRTGRRLSSSAGGHAVVADVGVGEGDDLPGVGRVGDDLLVAGQHGVEHDLAAGDAARRLGADGLALERRAVGQHQQRLADGHAASRRSSLIGGPRRRRRRARPSSTVWRTRPVQRAAGVGRVPARLASERGLDHPRGGRVDDAEVGGAAGRDRTRRGRRSRPAMAAGCQRQQRQHLLDGEVELGEGQRERRLQAEHARAAPGRRAAPSGAGRAGRGRWRWRRAAPSASPACTAATSASVRSGGFTLNTGVVGGAARRR